MRYIQLSIVLICILGSQPCRGARFPWSRFADQDLNWFRGQEAAKVTANVLEHQTGEGIWPKNIDTSTAQSQTDSSRGIFDNGATVGEVRFLARMVRATGRDDCRQALNLALDAIFQAQYPTGGWPQSWPPGSGYSRHITFNDGAMVNVMNLARDVAHSQDFDIVDSARRRKAEKAFRQGINCILKCQIEVDGNLTAWCAQHDEKTLQPRKGRSYEHASISGSESVGITLLLMSLDNPNSKVIKAVQSARDWFDHVQITGIRQEDRDGDKVIVSDPGAPPLWARFYEIGTNRPIFSGRDGVVRYRLADIEAERRNGYSWYGSKPREVLKRFAPWERQLGLGR